MSGLLGIYLFAGMVLLALIIIAAPTLYHDWKESRKSQKK
jgi:hypothetical protein